MRFYGQAPQHDLTYSDVFLVPSRSEVGSRLSVDLSPDDGTGASIPLVSANMNAVTGPRLAATLARRGGLGILPQDLSMSSVLADIAWVKAQPTFADSAFVFSPEQSVVDARRVIPPVRGLGIVVVSDDGQLVGAVSSQQIGRAVDDARVADLVHSEAMVLSVEEASDPQVAFALLQAAGEKAFGVVLDDGRVVGTLTATQVMRSTIYRPFVDASGRLAVGAAIGINGDVAGRTAALIDAGVDVLVVDTAHGHQSSMLSALDTVRSIAPDNIPIVAGNVVTADGVDDLVSAGATILKVGVGPGAMCTTRMMTAVGRPQFSAVLETSARAKELGAAVWADGGVRYPRDVALALAAGGASVMIGSWFAGTIEAPGEYLRDANGRLYKTSYGMASSRAVAQRFAQIDPLEQARKMLFSEGISESRIYVDLERPSVEDLIDQITAGVRSSCTYAGASTLTEFSARALVGIQSAAGYDEGRALPQSW